ASADTADRGLAASPGRAVRTVWAPPRPIGTPLAPQVSRACLARTRAARQAVTPPPCRASFARKVPLERAWTRWPVSRELAPATSPPDSPSAHDSVAIARDRPTFRRPRVYPLQFVAGLRRGHEIYDPLQQPASCNCQRAAPF